MHPLNNIEWVNQRMHEWRNKAYNQVRGENTDKQVADVEYSGVSGQGGSGWKADVVWGQAMQWVKRAHTKPGTLSLLA